MRSLLVCWGYDFVMRIEGFWKFVVMVFVVGGRLCKDLFVSLLGIYFGCCLWLLEFLVLMLIFFCMKGLVLKKKLILGCGYVGGCVVEKW